MIVTPSLASFKSPGKIAPSNADQVRKICQILAALSLDIASLNEAHALLEIKGSDDVNFLVLVREND